MYDTASTMACSTSVTWNTPWKAENETSPNILVGHRVRGSVALG